MSETTISTGIVRMYSFEAADRLPPDNPAHPLGQVLNRHAGDPATADSPWRKFFDPCQLPSEDDNPISNVISVEAAKLQDRWLDFQSSCSAVDRLDLEVCEPTIESVLETVKKMESSWRTKRKTGFRGKVSSAFHKFCGTLGAHQSLLKLLPEGSQYVSLFSGTLNAVITASINHEHIAGGFADALCAISENVAYVEVELEIFRTRAVLEKVADFYAHVFVFLSTFMDWITRKRRMRLLDSFNENAAGVFDADVQTLSDKSAAIRQLVEQSSRAEVRATRLTAEGALLSIEGLAKDVSDIRVGLQGMARQQAEMEYAANRWAAMQQKADDERRRWIEDPRGFEDRLLASIKHALMDEARQFVRDGHVKSGVSSLRGGGVSRPADLLFSGPTDLMPATTEWTSEAVSINSGHLENFFYRDRVRIPCDILGPIHVPGDLYPRLARWISGTSEASTLFWIDGPPIDAEDYDNAITMLATWIVHLASQAHFPTLSYFCELRRGDPMRRENSWVTQSLVAVVSALLRQMVELLLPSFAAEIDLSAHRFSQLEGTVKSWSEAMALLEDLGSLMPPGIICVVDGLHWVDDDTTEPHLTELIRVLRCCDFKVLLTTSGRSPCLRDIIDASEALQLETLGSSVEITGMGEDIFDA